MSFWQSLGFKTSPYDVSPLRPVAEDVELLVGRLEESITFTTVLESNEQGVAVISGPPGVGKTSFFNVNQYLLESQQAGTGPRLLAARRLCPIQPKDSSRDVALRALHALCRSTEEFCALHSRSVPKETKKILGWLNSQGGSGFDVGLEILGFGGNFGREVQIPSVRDISFEGLQDVIKCAVGEIVNVLQLEGAFIVLDNTENLEDEQLADLLITSRDTLFTIPRVWWILIGQSGLGSLIQALDPRVSERMSGKGLELSPISLAELDQAIERRVARFHNLGAGKAPLPAEIHERLYKASHGEIRFTFKYSNTVCMEFVKDIRVTLRETIDRPGVAEVFNDALGRTLVQMQIPAGTAESTLKEVVKSDLEGLNLKPKEKEVLQGIGEKSGARAMAYKDFGLKSMQDFSSNYLSKLHKQHLLQRQQQGRAVLYKLRGIAAMAYEFGLL
jgi:hypothetical protein